MKNLKWIANVMVILALTACGADSTDNNSWNTSPRVILENDSYKGLITCHVKETEDTGFIYDLAALDINPDNPFGPRKAILALYKKLEGSQTKHIFMAEVEVAESEETLIVMPTNSLRNSLFKMSGYKVRSAVDMDKPIFVFTKNNESEIVVKYQNTIPGFYENSNNKIACE